MSDQADRSVAGKAIEAVRTGDAVAFRAILDAHADVIRARIAPYPWSLLHLAAQHGRLAAVDLLLEWGLPIDTREDGDNTTPLFWAAAGGHLDVVRRFVAAGAHRAIASFLIRRGAHHHIFSAIAQNLGDEVRRIVASDSTQLDRRMSRNENGQTPLQFAVRIDRREMVQLLLDLGADPLATDRDGMPVAVYAPSPEADR